MDNMQQASQRALAVGRGRFRVRPPHGAVKWGGWSAGDAPGALERYSAAECGPRHAECGYALREHAWIAPETLVCPGDFIVLDDTGMQVVLKAGETKVEPVEATRWSAVRGMPVVEQRHGPCGRPLSEHGWVNGRLVCPGDWVLEGAQGICTLSPQDFFALYEAVP